MTTTREELKLRVGKIGEKKGKPIHNLAGRPFTPPALTMHSISETEYVVLDELPKAFDVETAVADLKRGLRLPVDAPATAKSPTPEAPKNG